MKPDSEKMRNMNNKNRIFPVKAFFILPMVLMLLVYLPVWAEEISPGDIVFSANVSGQWDLWVLKPGAMDPVRFTDSPGDERHPTVGPKGRHLAFVGEKRQLWVMDTATGEKHLVPLPVGTYAEPDWSADGNELVFVQYRALPRDSGEIWRIKKEVNRWGVPQKITSHPPMRMFPAWSPDGTLIACATFNRDRLLGVVEEIGVIAVDTGKFTALTRDQADSYWPAWSPDGKRIAYTTNLEGNYDVWMFAFPGGEKTRLTGSSGYDGEPSWSPDGREIVFVSNRTGNKELWAVSLSEKRERQLTNMKSTCAYPCWVK
jgi:TolB protein